jgi:hypothetical protein
MLALEVTLEKSCKNSGESPSSQSEIYSEVCLSQLHSPYMIKAIFNSTNIP